MVTFEHYSDTGGDSDLKTHAETVEANATYQSADIQNELISAAMDLFKTTVLTGIKKAWCWAMIADDTTDRQRREQLAVVTRYLLPDDASIWQCYEDTVSILHVFF